MSDKFNFGILSSTVEHSVINEVTISLVTSAGENAKLQKKYNKMFGKPSAQFVIDDADVNILVRLKREASRGNYDPIHGCSVKIKTPDKPEKGYDIPILKSTFIESNSNVLKSKMAAFSKAKISKKEHDAVMSFIYDNQAAILAYWNIDYGQERLMQPITKYLVTRMIEKEYYKNPVQMKTDAELDDDKKAVTEYVRNELNDQKIELKFDSSR